MKFCKTLQRAVEISDPSYVPYWTNYKRLKKLVKAISEENILKRTSQHTTTTTTTPHHQQQEQQQQGGGRGMYTDVSSPAQQQQHHHPSHTKIWESAIHEVLGERIGQEHHPHSPASTFQQRKKELQSNPREVAFFELLHAEFSKASQFFDKAQQQFIIREQLVSVGMQVLRCPQITRSDNGGVVKHRWGLLSKAVFLLYRDLLLFEVFAIMTYFAFSKILKKHDKVTGYHTRGAFMVNVVNKANFTTYPKILEMIRKCEELYNDASEGLLLCLYEDERLFLHMISEWNSRLRQPIRGAVEDTRSLDPPAQAVSVAAAAASASRSHNVPRRMQQAAAAAAAKEEQGEQQQHASSSSSSLRGALLPDKDEDREEASSARDHRKSPSPPSPPPSPDRARRILFPPSHPKFRGHNNPPTPPPPPSLSSGTSRASAPASSGGEQQEESESKKPASKKPRKSDDSHKKR